MTAGWNRKSQANPAPTNCIIIKAGPGISCHVSFYECLSNQRFSGYFEQDLGPLSSCVELYSVYSVTKLF